MRILIEEYSYDLNRCPILRETLHGLGLDWNTTRTGKVSLSYVGYFYNPKIKDCVFILPKVLLKEGAKTNENSEDGGQDDTVFGMRPEDIILIDKLDTTKIKKEERDFIYEFAVWIYRAIVVYNKDNKNNIIQPENISQISHTKRRRTNTMLDVILSLIQFGKDHQDFITFTLRNIHSGYNKINWTRTINRSQAIIQDGCPVYLNPVNKKRQVNFDEELLVIFYSILNYIKEKYGFKVTINVNFPLIKGAQFESYINGRGVIRLRQIKYKYFSDIALELWELCNAFFDRSQNIYSACELKEFLLAKNFYIVFEAIIDELVGSNQEKHDLDKKLYDQQDGKIIDHLYTYDGLIQSNDEQEQIYYIGDSKYYKIGHKLTDTSIYKQYTYARNIIQYNVSLWMDETIPNPNVKVRDDQTEGYNILPNFFISADIKEGDYKYTHREIKRIGDTEVNFQFHDRLFDRDTLLLSRYNVNFLFVIALYARNKQSEKQTWQREVRDQFREEIRTLLNDKYDFYAMKSIGNPLAGEQFLTEHFKELQGKIFRPFDDKNLYTLALEKKYHNAGTEQSDVYQLLSNFFVIEQVKLGENPKTLLDEKVAEHQALHPYQLVPTDWLPKYFVERYAKDYFVIGLYHNQAHWDWITGKNDKGTMIYNVRLGDRGGAIVKTAFRKLKPRFVILYNETDLADNKYRVFRVHDYAEMDKARMEKAEYPFEVRGDSYFIFRFDEEVSIGEFDIKSLVEQYKDIYFDKYADYFRLKYEKGQPLLVTGAELTDWRK